MKQKINSTHHGPPPPPERLNPLPETLFFPLDPAVNRCELAAAVRTGDSVSAGAILAGGDSLLLHTPVGGTIESANETGITLRRGESEIFHPMPPPPPPSASELPDFARDMGLAGMGGSMFPASTKLKAAANIHTLVINAVECEPMIGIDEALLFHDAETVRAGVDCLVNAMGIRDIVLAIKQKSLPLSRAFAESCGARTLPAPATYPAGAEKLIIARLAGRMPPAGALPVQLGYIVFSVASLWAIGRRMLQGEPSILRPLTLVNRGGRASNLIVPVGTPIGHVLKAGGAEYREGSDIIVAGGLMMGRRVAPETPVTKGTNAIFVQPVSGRMTAPEAPCILCGACFDVCPLRLHPSGMADRVKEKRFSLTLEAQLEECFLCGACSAVCPSSIPLVQYFSEGKLWLRKHK